MIIGIFCPSEKLDTIVGSLKLSKYRVLEYSAFTPIFVDDLDPLEILVLHAPHPRLIPIDLNRVVQICVLFVGNHRVIVSDGDTAASIPFEKLGEIELLTGNYKKYDLKFEEKPSYIA